MLFFYVNGSELFQLTHASGKKQKKLNKYLMLCVQFWAPYDGRRNRLKRRAFIVINTIV